MTPASILMRWAARHAGVKYRDFCLDPAAKTAAAIRCAQDFDLDWVTVMSDAWAEASAFGIQIDYPADNLPIDIDHLVPDMAVFVSKLSPTQVFSGKADPVSVIRNGNPEQIIEMVRAHNAEAGGRAIISAGCEVPPDTPDAHLQALVKAAWSIGGYSGESRNEPY